MPVDRVRGPGPGGDGSSFKPRVISDSPYFDAELLGALEAWVLTRCPGYNFSRELTGSYEESEIYALILLKDQNEPLPKGETKRFKFAADIAPDHPRYSVGLRSRDPRWPFRKRHRTSRDAAERHPFFAAGCSLLFSACADPETAVPDAVLNGNALVACSENAELSMQLGAAFGERATG